MTTNKYFKGIQDHFLSLEIIKSYKILLQYQNKTIFLLNSSIYLLWIEFSHQNKGGHAFWNYIVTL